MQNSLGNKRKYLYQTSERMRHLVSPKHRENEGLATKNLKVTGVSVRMCVCGVEGGLAGVGGGLGGVYSVSLWTAFECLRIECQ
jgi:hypothetical protein